MIEFISEQNLTSDQLSDPDYALKQIELLNNDDFLVTVCSKCHHCR